MPISSVPVNTKPLSPACSGRLWPEGVVMVNPPAAMEGGMDRLSPGRRLSPAARFPAPPSRSR